MHSISDWELEQRLSLQPVVPGWHCRCGAKANYNLICQRWYSTCAQHNWKLLLLQTKWWFVTLRRWFVDVGLLLSVRLANMQAWCQVFSGQHASLFSTSAHHAVDRMATAGSALCFVYWKIKLFESLDNYKPHCRCTNDALFMCSLCFSKEIQRKPK